MKRWIAGLVALALALVPVRSGAELTPSADAFVYGDNLTKLAVNLFDGPGRYNLTGASVAIIARTAIGGRAFDLRIPGTVISPTNGSCLFPGIGALARNPGTRGRDNYYARVVVTVGSDSGYTSAFTFIVTRPLP